MANNRYGDIRAGEMNRRVTILTYPETDDGQGGVYIDTAHPVETTVWAYLAKPHFSEGNSGGGPATIITQGFAIRKRDITTSAKIRYRGQLFKILHIDYSGVRNLMLTCQAVVHNG